MEFETSRNQSLSIETVVISDIAKTCRTCLASSTNLVPLHNACIDSVPLTDLLKILQLKVEKSDQLPPNICVKCVDFLCTVHNFVNKARENEKVLHHFIQIADAPNEAPAQNEIKIEPLTVIDKVELDINNRGSYKVIVDSPPKAVAKKADVDEGQALQCEICGKCFGGIQLLKQHMGVHNPNKPFRCPICAKGFSCYPNVQRHMRSHTGDKRYLCNTCGKAFIQSTSLKNHVKTHLNPKFRPYTRPICEPRPANVNFYCTQDPEGNDQCSICSQIFYDRNTLKDHVRSHLRKTFKCPVCRRVLRSKSGLELHMRLHTGENPHKCGVCDKSFKQSTALNIHMRVHQDVRPFQCTECSLSFRQAGHLNAHFRSKHTDERPFQCSYCDKGFISNGSLRRHERVHTREAPYVCELCGEGYISKDGLRRHKRRLCAPSHMNKEKECPERSVNGDSEGEEDEDSLSQQC